MNFRTFAPGAVLSAAALFPGATSGRENGQNEKVRHVWPLLVAPYRVAEYKIKENGVGDPVETPPYESPPTGLAVRKSPGGGFEKMTLGTNYIGAPVAVNSGRFELGHDVDEPGPGKGSVRGKGADMKTGYKPFADVALPGELCAVCVFPRQRNDWRNVSCLAVALDGMKPTENRALIFNVATAPVVLRLSAGGEVTTVASGASAFVPWKRNANGMMPVRAAVMRPAGNEIIANTEADPVPGFPVLVFLDSDHRLGGATATFLRGAIDPDAVKPVAGTSAK